MVGVFYGNGNGVFCPQMYKDKPQLQLDQRDPHYDRKQTYDGNFNTASAQNKKSQFLISVDAVVWLSSTTSV
jgi:hypothetical protein